MIKESKYCRDRMIKHFNKELVMTKKDNEDFDNSTYYWICDIAFFDGDVKIRYHCRITRKFRSCAHRDCSIKVKLNHKILVVSCNLRSYNSHLLAQDLGRFSLKIIVIPNGLESIFDLVSITS